MELLLYLATGLAGGMLSGMFGVGGGIIVVPILASMFTHLHFPSAHIMQLAIGTSLATIVVNSVSSAYAHHKHGNVDWRLVRWMAPTGVLGALLAIWLATRLHSRGLQLLFALFECGVALHLLKGQVEHARRKVAHMPSIAAFGGAVGIASSLLGIGGGTVAVPLLVYWARDMRAAIGTAAAIGLPLSVIGTLGYMVAGNRMAELPQPNLGFVYLPALAGIAIAGVAGAPLGVRLAQRLPVATLKKLLAAVLFGLGIKMGWSLL